MNSRTQFDALVIGAGPAGAVAALQLARAGLVTLLVDSKPFPRAKVCGGCLSARALAAFDRAGLTEDVAACGGEPFSALQVYHRRRVVEAAIPQGVALSRKRMDDALVGAAVRSGVTFCNRASAQVTPVVENGRRAVRITRDGHAENITARVVLVSDGLGHPSLGLLPEFHCQVSAGSRVGLGAVISTGSHELSPGAIHMAVGRWGYLGAVRAEDDQVCVAAAVDRAALSEHSPEKVVAEILREAGVPWSTLLAGAELRGTRPLTQHATRLAGERLLVVGDAAGYVEPFTGEGMAIALESALAAAPLAVQGIEEWRPELEQQWAAEVRRISTQRQQVIRGLAWLLRRPALLGSGLALAQRAPRVVRMVAGRMNRSTHTTGS